MNILDKNLSFKLSQENETNTVCQDQTLHAPTTITAVGHFYMTCLYFSMLFRCRPEIL